MKLFIFILILVGAFFYYLFFSDSINHKFENNSTALEDFEKDYNLKTENEIKEYTSLSNQIPDSIPEDQTFETIKNLLVKASGRTYSSNITLNTKIRSYLYTINAREEFKQGISSAFNLSYDEVDKKFRENKLVWDWVNQLKD